MRWSAFLCTGCRATIAPVLRREDFHELVNDVLQVVDPDGKMEFLSADLALFAPDANVKPLLVTRKPELDCHTPGRPPVGALGTFEDGLGTVDVTTIPVERHALVLDSPRPPLDFPERLVGRPPHNIAVGHFDQVVSFRRFFRIGHNRVGGKIRLLIDPATSNSDRRPN